MLNTSTSLQKYLTYGCRDECDGINDSGGSDFTCSSVIINPQIFCRTISGFDGIGVTVGISSQRRRRNIFHRDVSGDASKKLLGRDASRDDPIITLLRDTIRDNRRNLLRGDVSREGCGNPLLRDVSRDGRKCITAQGFRRDGVKNLH